MGTKSSALLGTWIDAESEKPPRRECFGDWWNSDPVLVTNGKEQWVCYWESWEDNKYSPQWKMVGPDGWQVTGITHWMPLPPLPNLTKRLQVSPKTKTFEVYVEKTAFSKKCFLIKATDVHSAQKLALEEAKHSEFDPDTSSYCIEHMTEVEGQDKK